MVSTDESIDMNGALRPLERRVLRLLDAGVDEVEIGRRFRRTPTMIRRIVGFSTLPRHASAATTWPTGLRPLEQRILRWRDECTDYVDIGRRFRRTPDHVRRVEALARYKLRAH